MPRHLLFLSVFLILTPTLLVAATPETMNFQALLDSGGVALDGTYDLTFALYDTLSGGSQLWSETHVAVPVSEGLANIVLGSVNPFGALPFDAPYWLGISIGLNPELSPRTPLTGAPYSHNTRNVDDGVVVKSVNGLKDDVTIVGGANVTVSDTLNTLTISASAGVAADDDWAVSGNDISSVQLGNVGIGNSSPGAKLEVDAAVGLALDVDDQLYVNSGVPFVGVGRSSRVASSELFGIGSSSSGWLGMYVRSTGSGSRPYYGYHTPEGVAYHYYEASTRKWHLFNNGNHITVKNTGAVGIGEVNPLERLHVDGNILAAGNVGAAASARVGQHTIYGSNYSAFWRDGLDYALLAGSNHTYLNAPISTGTVRLRIANSEKVVISSAPGNASVSLPASAVSNSEIENEAGAASALEGINVVSLTGGNAIDAIISRTITAPTSGYVLAIASAQVNLNHTNGTTSYADFGVSDNSTSFPGNQDLNVTIPSSAATGLFRQAITAHGLFSVSAGANTISLLGKEYSGSGVFEVFDTQLTLIFVPTAYGTVSSTLLQQPNIPDEEAPRSSPLTSSDIDRERAESIAGNDARIAAELAEIRERMKALESLVE